MGDNFSHESYLSPFTWRYGSDEMRAIWGEVARRRLWRQVWLELARAQQAAGLVTEAQVADLADHVDDIDVHRALEIEAEIRHDLMAEVRTYAEQCSIGGGIIHLGATSADIQDNADVLRLQQALDHVLVSLRELLSVFADQILALNAVVVMGYTHIQPAEPTTMGARLALYAQDLLDDYQHIRSVREKLRGKGFKGAVGTSASYAELLAETPMTPAEMEHRVMDSLGLSAFKVTGQTYPRKQDWRVMSTLSGLASSLAKFAFDVRILQSPAIGEWGEPFSKRQVGSSAMPFKRNPINAEKLNSLARLVASAVQVAHDNASLSLLERTLDDSANRREILPTTFLAIDEMLIVATRVVRHLRVDERAAAKNLRHYGTFAAVERVLMAAVKSGADRQEMHEHLREHSLAAWATLAETGQNPLAERLLKSPILRAHLEADTLQTLLDASNYTGDVAERAENVARMVRDEIAE